ncbi:uncharacterized protein L201_005563 [Kwoniella dendrophila CBS 6074]|uniref:Uncharacterized protein n=1 Tax=Kwoniella dendrophila CBS 6074 TaxID=1295534 RepID=A0AAX4K145_9TREE
MATPYRPTYVANPIINQPLIYPEPNPIIPMVQNYPVRYTYPTYPIMQQEPIMPIVQVQGPPTTIIKERYLPAPAPPPTTIIHRHSSPRPRLHTNVSTPTTIINKINNAPPIVNTPPPPPPMRPIHINRTTTFRFPKGMLSNMNNSPPAPTTPMIKPTIRTITTINRTTRRTTTKGHGRS